MTSVPDESLKCYEFSHEEFEIITQAANIQKKPAPIFVGDFLDSGDDLLSKFDPREAILVHAKEVISIPKPFNI